MEEVKDMETEIKSAMRARVKDFNDQADSLTLEGVRRMLEKDMGLETFALDAHKRFIKQCLQECFESIDEANGSKNTSENSQQTVQSVKEDTNPCEEPQMQKEVPGDEENGEESRDSVKKEISEHETEETQGSVSKSVPSKETIKNAIKKRASYIRANSAKITLSGVRRLLEEDLKLEKNTLDIDKNFINEQVDKVLEDPDVESKKEVKKKCVKKAAIRGSKVSAKVEKGDGSEDSLDSIASISGDEEEIQPERQTSQKGKAKKSEASKKRKRPSDEIESASNGKNKPVESITEKSSDADEGGNASEDNNSQSSAEENENVKKKSETSTTSYGKRVERLKSIIKSCGMSVPPNVYRKAKQAPESKREAYLIKEMEEILRREGLSTNPSEKEIKDVKRKKERAKELEGIDMSNIVSSTRRRSTSNFIMPPKPKVPVESEEDEEEDSDDDDDDDDDGSDSEDGSDGLNDDADDGSD